MAILTFQLLKSKNLGALLEGPIFSPLSNPAPNPVGSPCRSPSSGTHSGSTAPAPAYLDHSKAPPLKPLPQAPCFTLVLLPSWAIRNKGLSCPVQMSERILGGGHWVPRKSHSPHSRPQGSPAPLAELSTPLCQHSLFVFPQAHAHLHLPSRSFCTSSPHM